MEREPKQKLGLTRRQFLELFKNSAFLTIGMLLGFWGSTKREAKKVPPEKEHHFYQEGEIIETSVCKIKIKGWKLLFPFQELLSYVEKHPDTFFEFTLVSPGTKQTLTLNSINFRSSPTRHGEFIILTALPSAPPFSNIYEPTYLNLRLIRIEDGQVEANKLYVLDLKFYTYQATETKELIRIFSETDLGHLLKDLHELSKTFDPFSILTPVYIFDADENLIKSINSTLEFRIELPKTIFTQPKFPDEGKITLFHELAHSIIRDIILNRQSQGLNRKMYEAYENLLTKAVLDFNLQPPLNREKLENNPHFNLFDESSYINEIFGIKEIIGHPYDNYDELFASALTVMRFFPEKFLERYKRMNPQQRQIIKQVCQAVFDILNHNKPQLSQLEKLLPQYQTLRKLLEV